MGFSEPTKLSVKRKAHFSCCLCHSLGVEIHHIVPEGESGPDSEENAAPLCPSCHETYGANLQKRKFIKEARDFWYELCERRYAADAAQLDRIFAVVQNAATKDDLQNLVSKFSDFQQRVNEVLASFVDEEKQLSSSKKTAQNTCRPEDELAVRAVTISHLKRRMAVAQVVSEIVLGVGGDMVREHNTHANEAVQKGLDSLKVIGNFSNDDVRRIFQAVLRGETEPASDLEKVFYQFCSLYGAFIRCHTNLNIFTSLPSVVMQYYDQQPNRPFEELLGLAFD